MKTSNLLEAVTRDSAQQETRGVTIDRDQYDRFVASSPQGTLFCTTWWLDAVAPNRYRILVVPKGGSIQAAWPLTYQQSKLGGTNIVNPSLTPWLGILYAPSCAKLAKQLSAQKRLTNQLLEQLGSFDYLNVRFHRSFDYWSPLYWQGFSQTIRYTYVLEDLSDMDAIWAGLQKNIRTDIRKAQKSGICIKHTEDIDAFWKTHILTFSRQGLAAPYDIALIKRIDQACQQQGVRRIFVGQDKQGNIHAVAYIVWDDKAAYYLMGGGDPSKRSSGATSLVLWEAIRFASTVTKTFDFEGSMIESVERFFRAFGAKPQPCYVIRKNNSLLRTASRKILRVLKPNLRYLMRKGNVL